MSARTLQVSRVARLDVEYAPGEVGPPTLFLKLSHPDTIDPGNPEGNAAEVNFYERVAAKIGGPPLIRCFDSAFSAETGECHLLLEDLSKTHFQTAQGKTPTLRHSELAVQGLAQFHARWWNDPRLGSGIGKVFDQAWLDAFISDLESSVAKFLDFLGDALSTERRSAYQRMLRSSRTIWGRLTEQAGLTITHGDMHWWNFMYPNDPKADQARIFDWQLWHIDLGPRDLAFLLALGGFAPPRPELDQHLLRTYHGTLIGNGVRNYSWSGFWDDYRWSAIRNLNMPVIFWSQGKHSATWGDALERAFQSYNDLKCVELL